jgi:hypothetical protein
MEEYIELVLSMIVAYENYEGELNYTKDEITSIIKEYNIIEKGISSPSHRWNERGSIIFWRNGYLTNEKFAELMDIEYEGKNFWLVNEDFESVLPDKYSTEAKILDGTAEWYSSDFYDVDVEDFFRNYTTETFQAIIDFCAKKGFEIEDEDKTITLSKENMKIVSNEIIINNHINITDALDELDDLKHSLNAAVCEAQEAADQNETYKRVKREFVQKIGEFKWKTMKFNGKDREMLLVRVEFDWSTIEDSLKKYYGDYEFIEESYGSLYHILNEEGFFDNFSGVNFDYIYGSIDNSVLNEYTQNRLSWD